MTERPVIEKEWIYKEHPCFVVSNPLGYRCGYVGVSPSSFFYGVHYDDVMEYGVCPDDRDLTFSDYAFTDKGFFPEYWFIGFDCGHFGDRLDLEAAKIYYKDEPDVIKQIERYKKASDRVSFNDCTLEYNVETCNKLIDMIIKKEKNESANPKSEQAVSR